MQMREHRGHRNRAGEVLISIVESRNAVMQNKLVIVIQGFVFFIIQTNEK